MDKKSHEILTIVVEKLFSLIISLKSGNLSKINIHTINMVNMNWNPGTQDRNYRDKGCTSRSGYEQLELAS